MTNIINKEVAVTAVGFRKNLTAYPKTMEFEGKTYRFIDAGLSCVFKQSEGICQIVTLSDGLQQFRLRREARASTWTLLSMGA